jgi:Fe-S cluster assembly scaffold protein SufB
LSNGAFYLFSTKQEQDSLREPAADEGSVVTLKAAPHRVVTKTSCMPVVELVALDDAEIKYSTVQNWYPGNKEGKGGVFNFVTKEESVRKMQNLMDASRNGFCCHLEISICYT